MMGNGDKVLIMLGEAFFESSEQDATELCEEQVENFQATIEVLNDEETTIVERQSQLKKDLYGRFGKSIQLEDS
jgi:prefoldin subunit 4